MKRIIQGVIALGILTLSIFSEKLQAQNQYDFEDYVLNIRNTIIDVNYPLFKDVYGFEFYEVLEIIQSSSDAEFGSNEFLHEIKSNHEYLFELEIGYESLLTMAYSNFYKQNHLLFNESNYKMIDYAFQEMIDEDFEGISNLKLYSALLFFENKNKIFMTYIDNTIAYKNKFNLGDITTVELRENDNIKDIKKEFTSNKSFSLYSYLYSTDDSSSETYITTEAPVNEYKKDNTIKTIYKYRGLIDGSEYAIEMHRDANDNIVNLTMTDLKTKENVSLYFYYDMTSSVLTIQLKNESKSLVLLQTLNGNWNGSIYDLYSNILISTFTLNQIVK